MNVAGVGVERTEPRVLVERHLAHLDDGLHARDVEFTADNRAPLRAEPASGAHDDEQCNRPVRSPHPDFLQSFIQGHRARISPLIFFFSSRRRHTRLTCDWSSDVCSSDLESLRKYLTTKPTDNDPPHAATWYWLGQVQEKQGHKADAKAIYTNALKLAPGDKDIDRKSVVKGKSVDVCGCEVVIEKTDYKKI